MYLTSPTLPGRAALAPTVMPEAVQPSPEPPPSPSISRCDFRTTTTSLVGSSQFGPARFNMAAPARYCPSCLSAVGRTSTTSLLHRSAPAVTSSPFQQLRFAQSSQNALKYKRKDQPASQKKRKTRSTFAQPDLRDAIQFSLVDAMRYVFYHVSTLATQFTDWSTLLVWGSLEKKEGGKRI